MYASVHQRTSLSPDDVLEVHYVQDGLEVIVGDPLTMHALHGVRVYHLIPQAAQRHVWPNYKGNEILMIKGEQNYN